MLVRMPDVHGALIEVLRPRGGWRDRLRRYRIQVDGAEVGRLGRGGRIVVPVAPGRHEVRVRIDWAGSRPLTADLVSREVATFEATPQPFWPGWRGLVRPRPWVQLRRVTGS